MSAILLPAPAGVIVADPAWKYTNFRKSVHGSPEPHYGTMQALDIPSLPVASWAAKDCVLALWSTVTHLPLALRCMEAWGFEYTTKITWVKTVPSAGTIRRGIGHWAMAAHEDLLIGTKGAPPRLDTRVPSSGWPGARTRRPSPSRRSARRAGSSASGACSASRFVPGASGHSMRTGTPRP